MATPLLEVRDLHVSYGKIEAVSGVDLTVGAGEIVTVIGPNGAGKTTLLSAIMGILPSTGTVSIDGQAAHAPVLRDRVGEGLSLVPERRALFSTMSVEDNLVLGSFRFRHRPPSERRARLEEMYCAVNIDYQDSKDKEGNVTVTAADKLAEVAIETAKTAKIFGVDPKVAVLSFSTKGSGKGGTVALSHDATERAKAMDPTLAIDGELQFDAAVSPVVAAQKCKGSPVAGQANTFIFPNIEAGNIGYKIAQRLGGYAAYGPILQGLNAPINDLSRGCDAEEVYEMAIITLGLA